MCFTGASVDLPVYNKNIIQTDAGKPLSTEMDDFLDKFHGMSFYTVYYNIHKCRKRYYEDPLLISIFSRSPYRYRYRYFSNTSYRYRYWYFPKSPYRYLYFWNCLIDIDVDIDIFQNCLIDIDIDIDIFKNDHIDIDIDIDIFQKCRYIDNRYVISIYRTGLVAEWGRVGSQLS